MSFDFKGFEVILLVRRSNIWINANGLVSSVCLASSITVTVGWILMIFNDAVLNI